MRTREDSLIELRAAGFFCPILALMIGNLLICEDDTVARKSRTLSNLRK